MLTVTEIMERANGITVLATRTEGRELYAPTLAEWVTDEGWKTAKVKKLCETALVIEDCGDGPVVLFSGLSLVPGDDWAETASYIAPTAAHTADELDHMFNTPDYDRQTAEAVKKYIASL